MYKIPKVTISIYHIIKHKLTSIATKVAKNMFEICNLGPYCRWVLKPPEEVELQRMMEAKHIQHIEFTWNVVYALQHLLAAMIFVRCFTEDLWNPVFQLHFLFGGVLFTLIVNYIRYLKSKYSHVVHYFLPCCLFLAGNALVIENCSFEEFRIYEMWIIWYMEALAFCLSYCFHPIYIIIPFVLVQLEFLAMTYYNFGLINESLITVLIFSVILFLAIACFISYIFKSQIELIYQNQELSQTIKYILQVLPEGVLISSFKDGKPTIKYANEKAQEQLFENQPLEDTPTSRIKLRCKESPKCDLSLDASEFDQPAIKIGRILDQIQHEIDRTQVPVSKQIQVEVADNAHASLQTSFVYTLKSIPVNWDKCDRAYLHVVSDITSLKELEKQKATNQCMHIMFSSVSHEFRTPLNSFANTLKLLGVHLGNLNDQICKFQVPPIEKASLDECFHSCSKFLKVGTISAKVLENLVEDVLDFAKIEAGVFSLSSETFCVKTLIDELSYIFRVQCETKGLRFEVFCDQETRDFEFYSDLSRIRQALMNLVSNSLKFTSNGSIRVMITPFKSLDNDGKSGLKFQVSDTGVGISDEDQKNLFKLFGTVSKHKETLNLKGTGLGLTITHKLVTLLGGKIILKSEEGVGTTIEFTVKESTKIIQDLEESKNAIANLANNHNSRNILLQREHSFESIYNSQTSEKEFVDNLGYVQDTRIMEINSFQFSTKLLK
ncbi:unnamed protein product [Moneuplotes crassus]|uniref:histidine kinase n=1 Tax=Euplotes crassus TaxID=5936 RepID=A0AAD1TYS3_EUPCR|nr:unnamed protein product [Moneuplotes crassus]